MVKSLKAREPCLFLTIVPAILIGTYADIRVTASDEKEAPIIEVTNPFSWNKLCRIVPSNKQLRVASTENKTCKITVMPSISLILPNRCNRTSAVL